ncbi:MAG: N-acetyl-alpha-D-glucosaminyl L-malate synthase BshA [Chitinophagales bacterium]|nr:MAG: N-acetyl-alpha-D-glucosaminyl L-malate synthase BshA [Chitinophagales bacterium]
MKIGIVCYPTYGGSGVVATELGLGLADRGHDVHFIAYQQPVRLDTFHSNIYFHEVRIEASYPLFEYPPYETVLASNLVHVIRYEKLDLLHVHYAIPHASAAYIAKQILREEGIVVPVITTLHGTDITLVGKDATFAPVVAFSINHSDGITAVSENLKAETYRHFSIRKEIEVIPNFIDFSRFSKSNKDHFKKAIAPNGEKILIHVSNFRKVKRVEDVILVFQKVNAVIPCKLLMVGDGPERPRIEEMCRSLKVCEDVRFLGKQDPVEELLAIADLFILPSESESFGLAALEAMACQVPIISSNAGGIPEINIHGKTGFLSKIGDVDDMARNTIRLLQDENMLQRFRTQAYTHARQYDINNILPRYENFYSRVIAGVSVEQDK